MSTCRSSESEGHEDEINRAPQLKQIAGRYAVIEKLGRGLSGVVYSARDTVSERMLALKLSLPDDDAVHHLGKEFSTLSQLDHPDIVRAFDFGRAGRKRAYFTMSYVNGKPFTEYRFNSKQKFYEAIAQILNALQYIHSRGLVHCDLKPGNILVKRSCPKLLDFGLATGRDESASARGSMHYIAPELLRGARPDPRADLYSLGVVLYQALMHRKPFDGNSVTELMVSHVRSRPPGIRKRNVEPRLADIIMRMLEVDPSYRYESAEAVLEDLGLFLPPSACRKSDRSNATHLFTSPFVGRLKELERLEGRLKECAKGAAQIIFLTGDEGIGKSRLASEAKRRAQVMGFWTEHMSGATAKPMGEAREISRRSPGLSILEDAHHLDSSMVGHLSGLVKTHADRSWVLLMTCEPGRKFRDLRERLSCGAPWIQITLKPLSRNETQKVIEGMLLRMHDTEDIADIVHSISGGVPLLIEEAVRSLVSSGGLDRKRGKWWLSPDADPGVAPTKRSAWIVSRKLESLSEPEMRLLEIASLLKDGATEDVLKTASSLSEDEVLLQLISLTARRVIVRREGGRYAVANGYLSSSVRNRIPGKKLKTLHLSVARALEGVSPDEAAFHFMAAGEKDRAMEIAIVQAQRFEQERQLAGACNCYEIVLRAAQKPQRMTEVLVRLTYLYDALSDHRKALDAAERAIGLGSSADVNPDELCVKAANIHRKLGECAEAEALLEQVLSRTEDNVVRCSALCELAWLSMEENESKTAMQEIRKAKLIAEKTGDKGSNAKVHHTLGTIEWHGGKLEAAEKHMEKAVKLKVKLGFHSSAADSLNNLGVVRWTKGDMDGAERAYRHALEEFEEAGDRGGIAAIRTNLGLVEWTRGEWEAALKNYDDAYVIQEEIGDQAALARLDNMIGVAQEHLGNWKRALVHFRRHLRFCQSRRDKKGVAVSLNSLGSLLLKTGAHDEARGAFDRCLRLRQEVEDLEGEGLCLLNLAMVKLETKDLTGALDDIGRCIRIFRSEGIEKDLGTAYRVKAEIYLEMGWHQKASRAAKSAFDLSTQAEDRLELSQIHRVLAALQGSDANKKEEHYRKSISVAGSLDARYELGKALLAYGRFLLSSDGRLGEAVERLRDATEIFEHLGAARDLKTAQEACSDAVSRIAGMRGFGAGLIQVSALNEVAALIGSITDLPEFYQTVVGTMVSLLGAERGLLLLSAEGGKKLEVAAQSSMDSATVEDATMLSRSVVKEAMSKGAPVICDDAFTDPRFNQNRSVVLNNIHSLLCVPLKLRDEVLGTLYVDSRLDKRLFSRDDVPFVATLANMMAVAIENARYHDDIMRENLHLRSEVLGDHGLSNIIGRSPGMLDVLKTISKVGETDSTVLIEGETGTGKELVAHAIHYRSKRSGRRFLTIDCGALPESLLESELFGHQKGSFTGALSNKKGLFEVGDGGTVFLDEIGDAPPSVQSRLLRVLEQSEVRRIGDTKYRKVNVRIVCATNKDLDREVRAGRFRKDLFFRLNVLRMKVPPLRERQEDIPLLAGHFIERMEGELGKEIGGITPDAVRTLIAYHWPGNVRQLLNEMARACTLVPESSRITRQDLSPTVRGRKDADSEQQSLALVMLGIEKRIIAESLRRNSWNRSKASRELGLSRQGLLNKMRRHGLTGKESS